MIKTRNDNIYLCSPVFNIILLILRFNYYSFLYKITFLRFLLFFSSIRSNNPNVFSLIRINQISFVRSFKKLELISFFQITPPRWEKKHEIHEVDNRERVKTLINEQSEQPFHPSRFSFFLHPLRLLLNYPSLPGKLF